MTARDLIERIELMPWPGKSNTKEEDSTTIKALQSLVAEYILALEAAAQGVGNDSVFRMHVKSLEKLMVRDELYRREVKPKVRVSQQEIRDGLSRFAEQVRVLMIGMRNYPDAKALSGALHSDGKADSIIADLWTSSGITIDTVTVNFGELERGEENIVYALTSDTPVSEPLNVPRLGWVVLYLLEKETNPNYAKRSIPERTSAVTQKIRQRKELELASRYYADFLASRRAEAKAPAFELFARTIYGILASDSLAYRKEAGYRLDMIVDSAQVLLTPHLNDVLVAMDGRGMSITDVLESYRVLSFVFPNLDKGDFWRRLNASIKEVVARDLIAREGYRLHLDKTESVRHDVDTWSTYWLARALERRIVKDVVVSNEELVEYLIGHARDIGRDYEVNIREILSDSLQGAISIMENIIAGGNMSELARNLSKRREWATRDGESTWFSVADNPEIGFRALESDTGILVGPVIVAKGYSVFSVLGKRQISGDTVVSYDSLKMLLRQYLIAQKTQKILNSFIASAAKNYHVTFNYDHLKRVGITPTSMLTRRFIGFGGSMLAVPALYPLWQWVRETKDIQEIFP